MKKIRPQPVDPRVFGQGYSLAWVVCHSRTEVTEVPGRVGDAVPLPVPAPGYFHRPHRSPGWGFECATELTEVRVGV